MARLRSPQGHTLTLPPRRVSIGESAANEIPIAPGLGVADVHFHLQPWESGHFLEDAGSGRSTMVNGRAVSWAPLKHGDVISAGSLTMLYEDETGEPVPGFPVPPPITTEPELTTDEAPPPHPGDGGADSPESESAECAVPPRWLPPEALLPPVPPSAIADNRIQTAAPHPRRRRLVIAITILLMAAAAAVVILRRS